MWLIDSERRYQTEAEPGFRRHFDALAIYCRGDDAATRTDCASDSAAEGTAENSSQTTTGGGTDSAIAGGLFGLRSTGGDNVPGFKGDAPAIDR